MAKESTKTILQASPLIILKTGKDGTDANEKDWDAEMTRVKEKEWFARHPQYKNILRLCGIDRLMDTMISLLAQKMITEIPVLVREMRERKAEVGDEKNDFFPFNFTQQLEQSKRRRAYISSSKINSRRPFNPSYRVYRTFELCSQGHFICALFSFLSPVTLTPANKTSYCCF